MAGQLNISSVWKTMADVKINIGGTWRGVTNAYVNIGGVWKQFYASLLELVLFAAGMTPENYGTISLTTDIYVIPSDVRTSGTSLSIGKQTATGLGTNSTGYIVGGFGATDPVAVANTVKYNFSSNAISSGGSLVVGTAEGAGVGTSAFGIIAGGWRIGTYTEIVRRCEKYTYSNDSIATHTDLPRMTKGSGGCGNSTFGIISCGRDQEPDWKWQCRLTQILTYSSNTFAAGTQLIQYRNNPVAVGNASLQVVGAGWGDSTVFQTMEIYTYSSSAVTNGTSLGVLGYGNGGSNATTGVFSTANTYLATTRKYTFSGNTVSAGTSIATSKMRTTACGSVSNAQY